MTRSLPLACCLVLAACTMPGVVPVPDPDAGVDAGPPPPPRLVKVLYALQVELGEPAAWAAMQAALPRDEADVVFEAGLLAFGEAGQARVSRFVPVAMLAQRAFTPAVLSPFGRDQAGFVGPIQVRLGHRAAVDMVLEDFAALSARDRARVEYRVIYATDGRFVPTCSDGPALPSECPQTSGPLPCCVGELIASSRELRSIVELWDAQRVTLQAVLVASGADSETSYVMSLMSREGGTSLLLCSPGDFARTLRVIDVRGR